MSKYIIEIEEKPLCVFDKDTQTYFPRLWRVKGFNSLVLDKEGLSRLEELDSDYINEHFGDLQDTAYQKGFEDGKAVNNKGCEGCKYAEMGSDTTICAQCCNSYPNQWTAKGNKIAIRDEVVGSAGYKGVVTGFVTKENVYVMWSDGSCGAYEVQYLKKTGRTHDILGLLEAMKHD